MNAIRTTAAYSLMLSMNTSLIIGPDMALALTEDLEEDDDA